MIRKLGEICKFLSGYAWKASKFTEEGIPIIRINNMKPDAKDFKYWDWEEKYNEKFFINEGDILVSLSGTIKTYKWVGEKALLNQRIVKVTAKENINEDWIYYQITNIIEQIADRGKDAVIKNVSVTDLKNFKVDVPDLQTQNKIVALLDKSSSLLRERNKSISQLDELLRAQFLKMFGKANENFDVWGDVQIKSLAMDRKNSMRTGPFGSNLKHSEFVDNGPVSVLGIDNAVKNTFQWKEKRYITYDKYEDLKRYTVFPRDVIITIMGTVGRSAVIPENIPEAINTKHLACITLDPKKCNPYYLAYSIHSNPYISFQMKAREKGAIMAGLNLTIIKDLKLKDVPIEHQNRFETIYHKIQAQKETLVNSKTELENVYNALLQRAFSGQLNINVDLELDALLDAFDTSKEKNDIRDIVTVYAGPLLERIEKQDFKNQMQYEKAKEVVFQMLKEGLVCQKYDKKTESVKMSLV